MKKSLILLLFALPLVMMAQTGSGNALLNTDEKFVYEHNYSFYQFHSDGTGLVNFDYALDLDFCLEFTWKKKSANIITVTRDVCDEKVDYDVKIISNTSISVNEYEDKWTTYVLKLKSELLEE